MKKTDNKTRLASVISIAALLLFMTFSSAKAKTPRLEDEKKLSTEIMMLNHDAKMTNGDRITSDLLKKEFKVRDEKISALLRNNLDYGDIAAVLAIADKMSGGANDQNISRIMELHKNAAGWPQVASDLKVDLADVASKISTLEENVHKEVKRTGTGGYESGKGAGGGTPTTTNERDVGTSGADY